MEQRMRLPVTAPNDLVELSQMAIRCTATLLLSDPLLDKTIPTDVRHLADNWPATMEVL